MAKSRLVKRYKRNKKRRANPAPSSPPRRSNPPLLQDTLELVGPGFVAFAATRFVTRVASTQIAKRWPSMAKHAGAVASIGSFLAAWYLGNRVKLIDKYHSAVLAGAGIATGQTLIQTYLPKLGWVVSDATPDLLSDGSATTGAVQASTSTGSGVDNSFEILDENTGSWRYNNDASDNGRYSQAPKNRPPTPPSQVNAQQNSEDSAVFDMLETDDINDVQMGGIFS